MQKGRQQRRTQQALLHLEMAERRKGSVQGIRPGKQGVAMTVEQLSRALKQTLEQREK